MHKRNQPRHAPQFGASSSGDGLSQTLF